MRKENLLQKFLLLLVTILLTFPNGSRAQAELERISGRNRYLTSVKTSERVVDKSERVIIANGESFADTLSGGNLVNEWGAPILLVTRDNLPQAVSQEILRLQAKEIYLLGGLNTISQTVEDQLSVHGKVTRIAGANRYETSKKVIEHLSEKDLGLASGRNFADALAASAFLEGRGHLLLVNPQEDNSSIRAQYVFGGESSVPGFRGVKRFAGKNRYETAKIIAQTSKKQNIVLVDGLNFPDALSATILAKKVGASILLVSNQAEEAADYFKENLVEKTLVVGGEKTIPRASLVHVFKEAAAIPPSIQALLDKSQASPDKQEIKEDKQAKQEDTKGQKPIDDGQGQAVDPEEYINEVFRLTNLERERQGLAPLSLASPEVQSYARLRAQELLGKFSHTRPDGTRFFSGLKGYSSVGENISKNRPSPKDVVKAWMNSPGHRRNILNEKFTQLAVGYADKHWVQIFFTPLDLPADSQVKNWIEVEIPSACGPGQIELEPGGCRGPRP